MCQVYFFQEVKYCFQFHWFKDLIRTGTTSTVWINICWTVKGSNLQIHSGTSSLTNKNLMVSDVSPLAVNFYELASIPYVLVLHNVFSWLFWVKL